MARILTTIAATGDKLAAASAALTTAVMWALAALILYDVVMRTLNVPVLWAAEISVYAMIALAFLGAGATQNADGHFRVTFVRDLSPPRWRLAFDLVAAAMTLLLAVLFTLGAFYAVSFSYSLGFKTSTLLQIPVWILQSFVLLGGIFLSLAALQELVMLAVHGRRETAGPRPESDEEETA
ncbi:TRAP transporter small permease [Roseovarius indicus]|uniref:TRAP transporter small permease protein n=1 Tax=Roseovarius indicus TaxID=540747 RepID=A0A0T5P322_9RHOB|nr:TRAP transporter small permease [Roseovarius indicus]KRS15523.1 hypothetical protein XM52_23175 [Roseovarius indicus]OAO07170.1 hypothetical protein A8B76_02395 [Roseovarius indicus]QEW25286.1 2,3-diketo-L-gulonate TRAP transporter small permease protein YiaM [Roseovarius indicus]SFE20096.1 TRAP-type C4-dicarboxylate transport system, small permease component [Roseovarius indicus]